MRIPTLSGGCAVVLALTCSSPALAAPPPGPARVRADLQVTGAFHNDWGQGGGLDFTYSASVSNVKSLYYNSGDAEGFHSAKKRPYGRIAMRYIQTYPAGPGCEETSNVETISFGGPVNASLSGLRTEATGRKYKVVDRTISLTFRAEVSVHLFHHSVYDMFDCIAHDESSDYTGPVEIHATGRLRKDNRTGRLELGNWGPVYISTFGIGADTPPDWQPRAEGTVRFDRDVRKAA